MEKERLRIGLDAKRIVRNGTGLGNYGRALVNDLARQDGLDLRLYAPDAGRDTLRQQVSEGEGLRFCYPPVARGAARLLPRAARLAWWRSRGVVSQLQSDDVQVYHGLSGELPIGLRRAGIKSVVTIHDLIFMRHPEYYHPWDVQIYRWKFRRAIEEADRIIAISECTRRDIAELGGVAEERIDLVYQTCNPRFSQTATDSGADSGDSDGMDSSDIAALRLPRRYMLSVGSIEERKNLLLAVRALPLLPKDLHLVAVGRQTPYATRVAAEARRLGLAPRLHMLHGVSDAQLRAVYRGAEVFVYPSRYEGFGIPVIEAIHSGLPVVACTGSCLEEAGGPHNIYVSPDDAQALAYGVTRMLRGATGRDERLSLSREYVRRFEGRQVAAQVADIYYDLTNRQMDRYTARTHLNSKI